MKVLKSSFPKKKKCPKCCSVIEIQKEDLQDGETEGVGFLNKGQKKECKVLQCPECGHIWQF